MEYIGLLFEVLLLAVGVYVYLFSRGFVRSGSGDPAIQERAEAFRRSNGWWMRLAGLALMAIMGANVVLHVMQVFKR